MSSITDYVPIFYGIIFVCISLLLYLVFDYGLKQGSRSKLLLEEKLMNERTLTLAKSLESTGKYVDAAKEYDKLEFLVKAGECRKKAKIMEAENLEKAGKYEDAAKKYQELEMWDKVGEYKRKTKIAEAENLERAGRYDDAAVKYEELKMWDKAGDCRRLLKTNYVVSANVNIGKVGTVSMDCPYCGASQPIATKTNEVTCEYCKKKYVIPKKVLDLL